MNDALIICLVSLCAYFRILRCGDVLDAMDPQKRKWGIMSIIQGQSPSNSFNYFTSLIIHTTVSVLIYYFWGANKTALLAAILFCLNPVNNQASVWQAGKIYAISAMLILLSFVWTVLAPLFYLLTHFGAVNGIFMPLLFLLPGFPVWTKALIVLIPIAIRLRRGELQSRSAQVVAAQRVLSLGKIIMCFKTLGYYLTICIYPLKLGMFHAYMQSYGNLKQDIKAAHQIDRYFFVGITFSLFVLWRFIYHYDHVTFALIWFCVAIAMFSNFITMQQTIAERYVYLANIGLMYVLAVWLGQLPTICSGIVIGFYGVRLLLYLPAYDNIEAFMRYNLYSFPKACVAWNTLATTLKGQRRHHEALGAWIEGIRIKPRDIRINFNIATCLAEMGKFKDAAERFMYIADLAAKEDSAPRLLKMINRRLEKLKELQEKDLLARRNQVIDDYRKIKKGQWDI